MAGAGPGAGSGPGTRLTVGAQRQLAVDDTGAIARRRRLNGIGARLSQR